MRVVVGYLKGVDAFPGMILGPHSVGGYLCVMERDETRDAGRDGAPVGYATTTELWAAGERIREHGPATVAEHQLVHA